MPRTVPEPERTEGTERTEGAADAESAGSLLVAVDGRAFPLRKTSIDACAGGGLARSTLRQSYENPYDEPLEVIYTLPLPADGSVIGYTVIMGETRIVGEIETRQKAEEAYRRALEEGRTGGLLEQERADTFTQRLGNVPPRTPVEVEIDILHPVAFHPRAKDAGAEWEYRFPTVAGVRYQGGPGQVPDRERLDVPRADGEGTPVRLTFALLVADGAPQEIAPRSASHAIVAEADPARAGTRIRLEDPSRLDRDLTVSWKGATPEVGAHLIEGLGLPGDTGRYGLLTIVPPSASGGTFHRDLTLLIDASGSMSGRPIESAKKLGVRLLESLLPEDRFEISIFADKVNRLVRGPVPATPENLLHAIAALRQVEASGATEMADAITEMLKPLRNDSQRQVVVFTDGYIGFEQEIVRRVLQDLAANARLHMVGIGSSPNRTLTRSAARAGRGTELLLTAPEDAETMAARLLAATVAPVLTDLTIEGSAVIGIAPERPADLFAGRPVMLAVRLRPEGGEIRVRGMRGGAEPWDHVIRVAEAAERAEMVSVAEGAAGLPLGAYFGKEAIEDEEMKLAAAEVGEGEGEQIEQRIEALGLRHRIPSRRTSLVAIAECPSVDPAKPRRRERLAVELPAEVSAEGVGLAGAAWSAPPEICYSAMPAVRREVFAKSLGRRKASRPPAKASWPVRGRFLHMDGDLLVFEFESPYDGYEHPEPGTRVDLRREAGDTIQADVLADGSTYPGRYDRGLTVRLAVRLQDGWSLAVGERVRVSVPGGAVIELSVETD